MAGMKGRSGGSRAGAGRKPKQKKKKKKKPVPQGNKDMLELLQDVALGKTDATSLQVRAAIAAVQYTHSKRGYGGKKADQASAALRAASRFKTGSPPTVPRLDDYR